MGGAVAVILIKERRIVEAFERAGATSPDRAMSVGDVNVDDVGIGWRRLRERAVIREASAGRYYLDVEVWQATRRTRRRLMAVMLILVLAALMFGVLGTGRTFQ